MTDTERIMINQLTVQQLSHMIHVAMIANCKIQNHRKLIFKMMCSWHPGSQIALLSLLRSEVHLWMLQWSQLWQAISKFWEFSGVLQRGWLAKWRKWRACDVGEAKEGLELCSFSNLSVTSPTSQLILQSFRRFTYVTAHAPTLPLLHLRYSSFSNPSFASPTLQALHLRHLASRPFSPVPHFQTTNIRHCLLLQFQLINHLHFITVFQKILTVTQRWSCRLLEQLQVGGRPIVTICSWLLL